jgi:hypothetical protein
MARREMTACAENRTPVVQSIVTSLIDRRFRKGMSDGVMKLLFELLAPLK